MDRALTSMSLLNAVMPTLSDAIELKLEGKWPVSQDEHQVQGLRDFYVYVRIYLCLVLDHQGEIPDGSLQPLLQSCHIFFETVLGHFERSLASCFSLSGWEVNG